MEMSKESITITLTLEEANLILAALGEQPYIDVVDLIQKIKQQGSTQLQAGASGESGLMSQTVPRSKKTVNGE